MDKNNFAGLQFEIDDVLLGINMKIMKKPISIILLFFLCTNLLPAQDYWSKLYDLDIGNESGEQVMALADGYLVHVRALCGFKNRYCIGLMKFDFEGELLWKSILYDTITTNHFDAIHVRGDSILLHMNYVTLERGNDFAVVAFDSLGHYLNRFDYQQKTIIDLSVGARQKRPGTADWW